MKKWIVKAIVPAIAIVLFGALVDFLLRYTDDTSYRSSQVALRQLEHNHIVGIAVQDSDAIQTKYCALHNLGVFQHEETKEFLAAKVSKDLNCRKSGYGSYDVPDILNGRLTDAELAEIKSCVEQSKVIQDSCTASDKSGLHSKPRARCSLTILAGIDRFFAQEEVTVIAESYRKLLGKKAKETILSIRNEDKLITQFSGRIGCTNERGTGRTCRTMAAVQAISYPSTCKGVREFLKEIEKR